MSYTNSHDYTNYQIGSGQTVEINTSIPDFFFRRGAMTQDPGRLQLIPSRKTPTRGKKSIIKGLFSFLLLS